MFRNCKGNKLISGKEPLSPEPAWARGVQRSLSSLSRDWGEAVDISWDLAVRAAFLWQRSCEGGKGVLGITDLVAEDERDTGTGSRCGVGIPTLMHGVQLRERDLIP